MTNETLLLIDGFNLLSRGYFATAYGKSEEQLPKNKDGLYINGLRVFFQKLVNLIDKHHVTHIAIAWDVKRNETIRSQKYEFYKASRGDLPDPLIQQYETSKLILEQIGVNQISVSSYEADDIIGTLSKKWCEQKGGACLIYSNDRDLFQLLTEKTTQIIAQKGKDVLYTIETFIQDYSIHPNQWVDVKALLGDKSDNIPGCPGVGEKSALPLIQHYGSIENIYIKIDDLDPKFNRIKKKLLTGKETVSISKELSEIFCSISELDDVSFDEMEWQHPKQQMGKVFDHFGLKIKI
ncbi:5'-3' exonuclease [Fervidibacillus albus]|uniref:5'-3' exonuclease n=1 Tax=Fervidibacillus albus TaxID=2980026 RepID=A0A9E8LWQ4_9BACI|nr:5'-3' exonuclease H3TH domain-containing protein [Fervidibacillus albus]WAA11082.1 flap endonuclease [Fervidibacillus albus]